MPESIPPSLGVRKLQLSITKTYDYRLVFIGYTCDNYHFYQDFNISKIIPDYVSTKKSVKKEISCDFSGEITLKLKRTITIFGLLLLVMAGMFVVTGEVSAQIPPPPSPGIDNQDCLTCHDMPDQRMTLPSGEILFITVKGDSYDASVHGMGGYACVQCHTDITEYPHRELEATTLREFTITMNQSCARCHKEKFDATLDSVHGQALDEGNIEAAVCTDCHGAHNVGPANEPRTRIPHTCERCHSEIYKRYEHSVHGEALIGEGNPDVPTCIDCHGVHNVSGPSTSESFHLSSPLLCAECHADEELMGKYGISTDVFDTYISDFHGTTVLFESEIPGQETNKPVCIDCHGVHDMRKVNDPESTVIKENLLTTCQKCHPDANANFPSSWLGHYIPDRNVYPAVFYIETFYKIVIPVMVIGMLIFVISDFIRRYIIGRKERQHV